MVRVKYNTLEDGRIVVEFTCDICRTVNSSDSWFQGGFFNLIRQEERVDQPSTIVCENCGEKYCFQFGYEK